MNLKIVLWLGLVVLPATLSAQNRRSRQLTASPELSNSMHSNSGVRTLRVLALRVQFLADVSDQTTGNGRFDLGDKRAVLRIDPPPHNKRYFEDQLLAAKNYFLDVSDSNLILNYEVWPAGDTAAYTLSRTMEYYGREQVRSEKEKLLAELLHDAVSRADTADEIDFSQYDIILVFHAGVGQDFSNQDNTSRDLPSRFLSQDLVHKKYPAGIPVDGGAHQIVSGVIVPETESQFFIDPFFGTDVFREVGMSGILIANLGSAIGLPDMFNTTNGTPAIGVFGLEDFGAVNGDGFIPAEPDPWSKIYMGWAVPVIVHDSVHVNLLPKKLAGKNTILKVPIHAEEYFLIENRQRDVIPNGLSGETIIHIDTVNLSDNTIVYDTVYHTGVERSPDTKVITHIDEYDSALPGSGLLIWHIDERVIAAKLASNAINNDIEHRGVRVVEGSGVQNIGRSIPDFFATQLGSGDQFDFFYQGNEGFQFFNNAVDSVFFTPSSVPNSLSYDRANAGIAITQISPHQSVMSFNIRTSLLQKGFPQFTGSSFGRNALTFGDIAGDAKPEIIAAGQNGAVFAWHENGTGVIANSIHRTYHGLGGDSTSFPVALFAQAADSITVSPALGDLDNDGKMEVVVGTRGGQVFAWKAADINTDGLADTIFCRMVSGPVTAGPVVTTDKRILIGTQNGFFIALDKFGTTLTNLNMGSSVIGISLLNSDSALVRCQNAIQVLDLTSYSAGTINSENAGTSGGNFAAGDLLQNGHITAVGFQDDKLKMIGENDQAIPLTDTILSSPSLGDIEGDGDLEIVFAGKNHVFAYSANGTLVTDFPITLDNRLSAGTIRSSVLIGDVNDDGQPDVIVAAPNGLIYAFGRDGNPVEGFPLATGKSILSTPVLLNADADDHAELAVAAEDGFVYVYDLPAAYHSNSVKWAKYAGDAGNTGLSAEINTFIPVADKELIPKKTAYNYPNPAKGRSTTIRYFLTEAATVKIRIFDLAGDLVKTMDGPGTAQTSNEVIWNLQNIQSGVYFAKIHARSGGKETTRTVKIAVTH